MKGHVKVLALIAFLCSTSAALYAAGPPPVSYSAVEVDPFAADRTVALPADYQSALVDDIAREFSLAFEAVIIFHAGETPPGAHGVLRISGTVTRFTPGSRSRRYLFGLGAGAATLEAQVRFADAATRQVLLIQGFKGVVLSGTAGGDPKDTVESLAKKIVKLAKLDHLIEPN